MLNHYSGSFVEPPNGFTVTFTINPTTSAGRALADWIFEGDFDLGFYDPEPAGEIPLIKYESRIVAAMTYDWSTTLLITS